MTTIKVKLNMQELLRKVGIDKPHALWLKMGGSKSTPGTLWEGTVEGVQFNSLERILSIVRDSDPGLCGSVVECLNKSGIFTVVGAPPPPPPSSPKRGGSHKKSKGASKKRKS